MNWRTCRRFLWHATDVALTIVAIALVVAGLWGNVANMDINPITALLAVPGVVSLHLLIRLGPAIDRLADSGLRGELAVTPIRPGRYLARKLIVPAIRVAIPLVPLYAGGLLLAFFHALLSQAVNQLLNAR